MTRPGSPLPRPGRPADGGRIFIKAVGTEMNPQSPGMYRDEAAGARGAARAAGVARRPSRAFQESYARSALEWVRRRTGWQ